MILYPYSGRTPTKPSIVCKLVVTLRKNDINFFFFSFIIYLISNCYSMSVALYFTRVLQPERAKLTDKTRVLSTNTEHEY